VFLIRDPDIADGTLTREASLTHYPAMPPRLITVAETQLFLRQAADVWSEEERHEFVDFIASHPDAGEIIPDTGGVRKIRWRRQGVGKRGGVRVIYFYFDDSAPLYLLTIYAKSQQEDLSPEGKQKIKSISAALKEKFRD